MKKTPNFIRGIVLAGILLLQLAIFSLHSRGAAGDVDLSFDPGSGVNGTIKVVAVQPDGNVIIAGQFTTVKGLARPGLARLDEDGTGDATFNPGIAVNGLVSGVALQSDGKVLVTFQSIPFEGSPSQGEAVRLNSDGSLDNSFLRQNGNAYPRGSSLTAVVVQPDGKVVFAGTYNGWWEPDEDPQNSYPYQRFRIYRVNADGSNDDSFLYDSSLPLSYNFLGLHCLALQPDGKVLFGGNGTLGHDTAYKGITRLHADGSLDSSFNPGTGANAGVFSIGVQPDGKVLIGGNFTTVNGTNCSGIARLHADGSSDNSFSSGMGAGYVFSIALQTDGKVIMGGGFATVNGTPSNNIARLDSDGNLDPGFNPGAGANSVIYSVALHADGKVVAGGSFSTFDGASRERAVRLHADGSRDEAFFPGGGINGSVRAISLQSDGKLLIGGQFTAVGGALRNRVARLHGNGAVDSGFDAGPRIFENSGAIVPQVTSLVTLPDGRLLIGGDFDGVNGSIRRGIARLQSDGSLDDDFHVDFENRGGHVNSIGLHADGKVLVCGSFNTVGGTNRNGVAKLIAGGGLDSSFNPVITGNPGTSYILISSVLVQPDNKALVAGHFVHDSPAPQFFSDYYQGFLLRLNADGSPDAGFVLIEAGEEPQSSIEIVALAPDGKVLIGGNFVSINGTGRNGIARLNADGSLDNSFNPGSGVSGGFGPSSVVAINIQPDGRILIGGDFTTFNGSSRNRIARLHPDGGLDSTFLPGAGVSGNLRAMALQPDGRVIVSSNFNIGLTDPWAQIVRLYGDSAPASFAVWVAGFGLTGADASAFADPDHDGVMNGVEYVAGENPAAAATSAAGRPMVIVSGGNMIFTFSRDDLSETADVTLTVEAGTDLVTWPGVFTIGPNAAASSSGVSITENGPGPDTITVTLPAGTTRRQFARLKVAVAP